MKNNQRITEEVEGLRKIKIVLLQLLPYGIHRSRKLKLSDDNKGYKTITKVSSTKAFKTKAFEGSLLQLENCVFVDS